MPTYTFRDKTTNKTEERFCSISKMEAILQENPNLELVIAPSTIVAGVGNITELAQKKHPGWKERLQQIHEAKKMGTLKHWIK